MNTCYIPEGYRPALERYDLQRAIELVSHTAPTMERTALWRAAALRSSGKMIFSQSHWST